MSTIIILAAIVCATIVILFVVGAVMTILAARRAERMMSQWHQLVASCDSDTALRDLRAVLDELLREDGASSGPPVGLN